MRYVWEVTATGGDPTTLVTAIEYGIGCLRAGDVPSELLDHDEVAVWAERVSAVHVGLAASHDADHSVLVDIDLDDEDSAYTAAVLSGGFDAVVLELVIGLDGVIACSHSDRIQRVSSDS